MAVLPIKFSEIPLGCQSVETLHEESTAVEMPTRIGPYPVESRLSIQVGWGHMAPILSLMILF